MIHFFGMAYRTTQQTEARRLVARTQILERALELVADGGYAALSANAAAAAAGVSVGTLYRHFPSKSDLAAQVFTAAAEPELAVVTSATVADGRTVAERIATGAEAFCRRALASPTLAYAQLAEPVDPLVDSARLRLRRGYRDVFARVLDDGVASGELAPHDTTTVAAALVGGLGEALVGPLGSGGDRRSEALVATLVQFSLSCLPTSSRPTKTGSGDRAIADRAALLPDRPRATH